MKRRQFAIILSLTLTILSGKSRAVEVDVSAVPAAPSRPDFMRNKPYLPDLLLRSKTEGRYFTLMPAIGWDPETGFNFGAFVEFYQNGSKTDPFFSSTPYRQKIFVGLVGGTNEFFRGKVGLDQPYLFDSPYRLRLEFDSQYFAHANYFGVGDAAMGPLTFPGSGTPYGNYEDYKAALERDRNGQTYALYDEFSRTLVRFNASIERDLLGGILRPFVGLQFGYTWITDHSGDQVDAKDAAGNTVQSTQQQTKLAEDCAAGRVLFCDGGLNNFVKLGITLDTRNFEPDPDNGILAQITAELSPEFMSESNYARITTWVSGYYGIIPDITRLILAARIIYTMSFGDVPVYSLNTHATTIEDKYGLGAFQTMRGYVQDRFIGKSAILTNYEVRWNFAETVVLAQHLRFSVVPFLDFGRVFDDVDNFSFEDWRWTAGGGLKLAWNLSTIISFDYGTNEEHNAFYMELGHQF